MGLSRLLFVIAVAATVAGCDPSISCGYLRQYDRATQDRALRELAALPKGSALRLFMGDYATLRDQVRACQKGGRP